MPLYYIWTKRSTWNLLYSIAFPIPNCQTHSLMNINEYHRRCDWVLIKVQVWTSRVESSRVESRFPVWLCNYSIIEFHFVIFQKCFAKRHHFQSTVTSRATESSASAAVISFSSRATPDICSKATLSSSARRAAGGRDRRQTVSPSPNACD